MAGRTETALLEQEYCEFWKDFIAPKNPWKDDSHKGLGYHSQSPRTAVYPYLKEKFDIYQMNDALIQRLNGNGQDPPSLISIVRDRYGCWEGLQVLLKSEKLDVNALDRHVQPNARTALSYAAGCHDAASMGLLLKYNANPTSTDENGLTPLMWMIEGMQPLSFNSELPTKTIMLDGYMIRQFCEYAKGMSINCQDKRGQTALMLAAKKMRYDLIRILIAEKADPRKTDIDGHTWFWWLLMSRKRSKPIDCDTGPEDPVFKMAKEIDLLTMNTGGRTLLSWAVEFQDLAMVKALLEIGADANIYDEGTSDIISSIPFLRALESNMDIAKLFSSRARVWNPLIRDSAEDKYSLHVLTQYTHFVNEDRALNLLGKMYELDHRMDTIGPDGKTPLHHAIGVGNERFALGLLLPWNDGNTLDVMDNEGKTPLFYALKNDMSNVVQQLVQKGANIDLSLEWFRLGTDHVRFTLDAGNKKVEFMRTPPHEQEDKYLTGMTSCGNFMKSSSCHYTVSFLRKEGMSWPWRRVPKDSRHYTHHACSKIKRGLAGWTTSHIAVLLPNREKMDEIGDFWSIQCGGTSDGKQIELITTIPSTTTPKDWNHLCEQLIEQLLETWESLCEDESNEMEDLVSDRHPMTTDLY